MLLQFEEELSVIHNVRACVRQKNESQKFDWERVAIGNLQKAIIVLIFFRAIMWLTEIYSGSLQWQFSLAREKGQHIDHMHLWGDHHAIHAQPANAAGEVVVSGHN